MNQNDGVSQARTTVSQDANETRAGRFQLKNFILDKLQAVKNPTVPRRDFSIKPKPRTAKTSKRKKTSKEESEDSQTYEVEKLIGKRILINGSVEYLIVWKGYKVEEATWVNQYMMQCEELIEEYDREEREKRNKERRKKRGWVGDEIGQEMPETQEVPCESSEQVPKLWEEGNTTTESNSNVETPEPDLLTQILKIQASPFGKDFINTDFDDFELSSKLGDRLEIFDLDLYRNTQPTHVVRYAVNSLGDPFVLMHWEDGFEMGVTFPAAVKFYPIIFVPWLQDYAKAQAEDAGCSVTDLMTAETKEDLEMLLEKKRVVDNESETENQQTTTEVEKLEIKMPEIEKEYMDAAESEKTKKKNRRQRKKSIARKTDATIEYHLNIDEINSSMENLDHDSTCASMLLANAMEIDQETSSSDKPMELQTELASKIQNSEAAALNRSQNLTKDISVVPSVKPSTETDITSVSQLSNITGNLCLQHKKDTGLKRPDAYLTPALWIRERKKTTTLFDSVATSSLSVSVPESLTMNDQKEQSALSGSPNLSERMLVTLQDTIPKLAKPPMTGISSVDPHQNSVPTTLSSKRIFAKKTIVSVKKSSPTASTTIDAPVTQKVNKSNMEQINEKLVIPISKDIPNTVRRSNSHEKALQSPKPKIDSVAELAQMSPPSLLSTNSVFDARRPVVQGSKSPASRRMDELLRNRAASQSLSCSKDSVLSEWVPPRRNFKSPQQSAVFKIPVESTVSTVANSHSENKLSSEKFYEPVNKPSQNHNTTSKAQRSDSTFSLSSGMGKPDSVSLSWADDEFPLSSYFSRAIQSRSESEESSNHPAIGAPIPTIQPNAYGNSPKKPTNKASAMSSIGSTELSAPGMRNAVRFMEAIRKDAEIMENIGNTFQASTFHQTTAPGQSLSSSVHPSTPSPPNVLPKSLVRNITPMFESDGSARSGGLDVASSKKPYPISKPSVRVIYVKKSISAQKVNAHSNHLKSLPSDHHSAVSSSTSQSNPVNTKVLSNSSGKVPVKVNQLVPLLPALDVTIKKTPCRNVVRSGVARNASNETLARYQRPSSNLHVKNPVIYASVPDINVSSGSAVLNIRNNSVGNYTPNISNSRGSTGNSPTKNIAHTQHHSNQNAIGKMVVNRASNGDNLGRLNEQRRSEITDPLIQAFSKASRVITSAYSPGGSLQSGQNDLSRRYQLPTEVPKPHRGSESSLSSADLRLPYKSSAQQSNRDLAAMIVISPNPVLGNSFNQVPCNNPVSVSSTVTTYRTSSPASQRLNWQQTVNSHLLKATASPNSNSVLLPEQRFRNAIINEIRREFRYFPPAEQEKLVNRKWIALKQSEREPFITEYRNECVRLGILNLRV